VERTMREATRAPRRARSTSMESRAATATAGAVKQRLTGRQWWCLTAILAVAGCLRIAWVIHATKTPSSPLSGDPFFYQYYGKRFAAGHGYDNFATGEPTAYYPVGYPLLLAGVFWVVRHTPLPDNFAMATSIFQVMLGTASVALIFVIARRLFSTGTGLVAAAVLAMFPNVIFYTANAQLETVFTCALLAAVAVAVSHDWAHSLPTRSRMLTFGALLGVSALVRPFSLPLLVGLALAFLAAGHGWRRMLSGVGWAALAFGVIVAPWLVRNAIVMHAPTFSTNMGDTVCIDRYVHSTARFRFVDSPRCAPSATPEAERNSENLRFALRFVRHHPGDELGLIGKRFWYMMERDDDGLVRQIDGSGDGRRATLSRLANGYYFVMLPLAMIGVVAMLRRRRPDHIFVLSAIAALFAIPMLLWGNTRFHFPILPFIAMAAAVPVARLLSYLSGSDALTAEARDS